MSTTAKSHKSQPDTNAVSLQPVLSQRLALGWKDTLVCAFFCVLFMYLNYIPLFYSDIWGHVHFGEWILAHGSLPTEDPFMPLAAGVDVIDTAWLAQVLFALAASWGGAEFVSNLFVLVVFSNYLVQARVYFLLSKRLDVTIAGILLSLLIGFSRHAIVRPEIFGGLCFSTLMWICLHAEPWRSRALGFASRPTSEFPKWLWVAVPALFILWANLHGSFAVGLVFLACHALGRMGELAISTRNVRTILADRGVQRWVLLTQAAVVGSLVNPYGLDLLIATAQFGGNPNLKDVIEWYPLKLIDLEGIGFAISIVVLIVALRHSRQRVGVTDVLLLAIFSVAVALRVRMNGWFAPVLTLTVLPHLADIANRLSRGAPARHRTADPQSTTEQPAPKYTLTLVCGLLVWTTFAFSPISHPLLGGKGRQPDQLYNHGTPRALTQYLRENPPPGMVFGPQWWGDWLAWDGPPEMRIFMTTNVHLVPNRVWRDYLRVARGQYGWGSVLDRYNVDTLIVHKELQEGLTRQARGSSDWHVVYEDDLGLILQRNESFREKPDADQTKLAGSSGGQHGE